MNIILASTSPRRIEMMNWLGIEFKAVPSNFDEKSIRDTDPANLTQKLAKAKAMSVVTNFPNSIVIGSDLVVAFEGKILEKVDNDIEQRNLIILQRGKVGEIYASVYILNNITNQEVLKTIVTPYLMANVSDEKIDEYIKSGLGVGKAGGFGFQDFDGMFIESINGCYSNVLGMPMCEVSTILSSMGIDINVDIKQVVMDKTGREC